MRFFSKIIFVFNVSFLLSIIFRMIELHSKAKGKTNAAIPLPFIEGSLAIMGQVAIIFNVIFCLIALTLFVVQKKIVSPKWIGIFNFIVLLAQVYWYFISK